MRISHASWLVASVATTACLFPDYEVTNAAGNGGVSATGGSTGASGGDAGSGGSAGSGGNDAGDACVGAGCATEICSNLADDDADGKIDCLDLDCTADPACGGICTEVASLPCDSVRNAQRTDATGSTRRIGPPLYSCTGIEFPGPELAYRFSGAVDQNVMLEIFGMENDLGLFVVDVASGEGCDATSACSLTSNVSAGSAPEALGFSPVAGRDYYVIVDGPAASAFSLSVQCSPSDGCFPARAIEAGQMLTAENTLGLASNVTQNLLAYTCGGGGNRTAPEAAFMFTPAVEGDYRVTLTAFNGNLDLFIVQGPTCSSTCLAASNRSASQDEDLTFSAIANTTYYIVVDGYVTSSFELGVAAL